MTISLSACTKGCNRGSESTNTPPAQQAATPVAESQLEEAKVTITDSKVGDGAEAVAGKYVTVHYRGTLQDGKEFDSAMGENSYTFHLGTGEVIKGWDRGLLGMKVGGKRKLIIPPTLAYGAFPVGIIPANSTLTFEFELLSVSEADPTRAAKPEQGNSGQ